MIIEYAILDKNINVVPFDGLPLFKSQDPREIIKKLRADDLTDVTIEIYQVDDDGDFLAGSDYDTPDNFIKRMEA